MKISNFVFGALLAVVITGALHIKGPQANEGESAPALQADHVGIRADKVMNGVTDITLDLVNDQTHTQERILLQCDATSQSLNVFYYLNDILGGKAKSATRFRINVYGNGRDGLFPKGDSTIFDGSDINSNLRKNLNAVKVLEGRGFISFEFFTVKEGQEMTIAHSMLIPSYFAEQMLKSADTITYSEGCDINGGFTTVHPLKNLSDQI